MTSSLIQRVRQTVKNATRKLAKLGMVAIATAVLTAPVTVQAQTQLVNFQENNSVEANGNGKFSYEIKLSEKDYSEFKKKNPNTDTLLRKMGFNNSEMVIDNLRGTWNDETCTLKIEYTVKGVARAKKDLSWELTLLNTTDAKLVSVGDGSAMLNQQAFLPGLGLAECKVRVKLPAGASDVKVQNSRLSYKLPVATTTSGSVAADFNVEVKPQLMTALAKIYGDKQFTALHAARSQFKNSGDQTLKNYKVRFRIAQYAPNWSYCQTVPVVVPGQTVVDMYFPAFDLEKVGKLTGSTKATLEIEYSYTIAGGETVEETETKELLLLSRNQVYFSNLKPKEIEDFQDRFELSGAILAAFTTHEDPVIQQAAGRIANALGGINAAGSDEEAEKYMKAVFEFMSKNIAYQTPPSGHSANKYFQHVKYGRDVLRNKAGTCIDLAILYGSLCEAVGLEPVLYVIPGHCFPAVRLPSGRVIAVEATAIGAHDYEDAVKHAMTGNMKKIRSGDLPHYKVDIVKLHSAGFLPIDLPTLADDVLTKWGIEFTFGNSPAPPKGGSVRRDEPATDESRSK